MAGEGVGIVARQGTASQATDKAQGMKSFSAGCVTGNSLTRNLSAMWGEQTALPGP